MFSVIAIKQQDAIKQQNINILGNNLSLIII